MDLFKRGFKVVGGSGTVGEKGRHYGQIAGEEGVFHRAGAGIRLDKMKLTVVLGCRATARNWAPSRLAWGSTGSSMTCSWRRLMGERRFAPAWRRTTPTCSVPRPGPHN